MKAMTTMKLLENRTPINQLVSLSEPDPEIHCAAPRKRILVADDDLAVRTSLARVLEAENYVTILASTGRQAVSLFTHDAPDLVLLDINMPDKDGWQAFELMERSRPLVPMIVITARPNQYERATRLGIDALMEKPLDLPLLLQTIQKLLGEPPRQRIAHLTAPDFATTLLSRGNGSERKRWY